MCRVVLMNKEGEREIEKRYGLSSYFKYLEDQLGGHGNGYALLKNNRIIKFEKGMNLDVRDIAKTIKNTDYDWCVFHTRLKSVGDACDRNCHPFLRGNFLIAMNGTEHSVSFISKIKGITDTEAILDVAEKYHLGLTALKNFSSIFMGFYKGKPFVVADNTHNIRILKNKNAIVFASSFPIEFNKDIYDTTKCFIWYNGKLPNTLVKHKKRYYPITFFDDYFFNDGIYSQCYLSNFRDDKKGAFNGTSL